MTTLYFRVMTMGRTESRAGICDVLGTQNFPYTGQRDTAIRQEARKAAGMQADPYSTILDHFGNRIFYNRKIDRMVQLIPEDKYLTNAYTVDPLEILDNQTARNAIKAGKQKQSTRERYRAERSADNLTIKGEKITDINASFYLDEISAEYKKLKQKDADAWKDYLKKAKAREKELKELAEQKESLESYMKVRQLKANKTNTYTAREAARKMQAAKSIPTAAPTPQNTPAAPEEPKGAFFDPAKYQISPTPSAGMNPDDCDFI